VKSAQKLLAVSTTARRWKPSFIVAIGLLACGISRAEDFSNMVWMRTDEQRITGNAKLEQQDRDDRAACLKAVSPTGSAADMFKGCMAAKGYVMTTRTEAEARLAAHEAARSANRKGTKSGWRVTNSGQAGGEKNDRNVTNRHLLGLTEKDRRTFFSAFLGLSGESCPEVVRTFYKGSAKPSWNAIWNVECKGALSYSILVMSDEKGSSKVMTCGELRAVGGGECFVRND
jgi:hypothetical protein